MPRRAREKSSSGIYHVMLRGINKQLIFEDDEDRQRFLETLSRYKQGGKYKLYSYCLMDNHVHLLIREQEETLSVSIKRVSSSYVYWFNRKYERCGHLFQDRYRSEKIESAASFLKVVRYIHQNPVKAGLAGSVFECQWTSMREYEGSPWLISVDQAFGLFSKDLAQARGKFRQYMQETSEDEFLEERPKYNLPDSVVKQYICEMGVSDISSLQQMDKDKRDKALAKIKQLDGVSVRQLSRVTGISRSVIQRVR